MLRIMGEAGANPTVGNEIPLPRYILSPSFKKTQLYFVIILYIHVQYTIEYAISEKDIAQ